MRSRARTATAAASGWACRPFLRPGHVGRRRVLAHSLGRNGFTRGSTLTTMRARPRRARGAIGTWRAWRSPSGCRLADEPRRLVLRARPRLQEGWRRPQAIRRRPQPPQLRLVAAVPTMPQRTARSALKPYGSTALLRQTVRTPRPPYPSGSASAAYLLHRVRQPAVVELRPQSQRVHPHTRASVRAADVSRTACCLFLDRMGGWRSTVWSLSVAHLCLGVGHSMPLGI